MTGKNLMVEQQIKEYQSRLTHIDELIERATKGVKETSPHKEKLTRLQQERNKLAAQYDKFRLQSVENWRKEEIEKSGPMAIWDALAQQLEKLVESLER